MAARRIVITLGLLIVLAAPARGEATLGIQGLLIQGTHSDQITSTPLVGAAALLEAKQRFRYFDIDVEGAPSTGAHGYLSSSGLNGQAFTSFSVLNSVAHARLGPTGRYWAGGGVTVINQITAVGAQQFSAASRLAGGRYQAVVELPVGPHGILELRAADMPSLHGSLSFALGGFQLPANQFTSETAEATDWSAAYTLRSTHFAYSLGFRSINYIAYFVTPHELADRNVVYGPTLEVRWIIAK